MKVLVTGAGGLVGSAAAKRYLDLDCKVIGIENNRRKDFFGEEGSTQKVIDQLAYNRNFKLYQNDITDRSMVRIIMGKERPDVIIHTAAQPSHDWAAKAPYTDFTINAVGTLNLLEAARMAVPNSPFCHISTSKVYGDNPNRLPLIDHSMRFDLPIDHEYHDGITTSMSIDKCLHSLFGVSKASGDLLAQEYGKYFDMPTLILRPGCVTGPQHAGVELHGFLAYLVKCVIEERPYTVYGYEGKQVRCNIHADDLVDACIEFVNNPRKLGEAYNIGGGTFSSCSMLEAIDISENIAGKSLNWKHIDEPRIGDHKWWISDIKEFQADYPDWRPRWPVGEIIRDIYESR